MMLRRRCLLVVIVLLYCHAVTRSFQSLFGTKVNKYKCDNQQVLVRATLDPIEQELSIGRPHSAESKAKISAANKGKQPWNVGKAHSEETKRLIAEKTKEAMLKKKEEQAALLGMTLDEYTNRNKIMKAERQKSQQPLKQGLTEDGRRRISESLKKRWKDPEYRARILFSSNVNRSHSFETRARISEAIKLKWKDDEYRSKIIQSPSPEVRARISATLKLKWENPEFRQRMMNMSFERTDEWREAISIKIRAKWMDEKYRSAVTSAIKESFRGNRTFSSASSRMRRRKAEFTFEEKIAYQERLLEQKRLRREREKQRRDIIKAAKFAKKGDQKNASLKELLGGQLWFEEKLKRRKDGLDVIDDNKLEEQLLQEWAKEDFSSEDSDSPNNELEDFDILVEDDESSENSSSRSSDYSPYDDQDFSEDIIEVYDETGELIATYDADEYAKLKSSGSR